MFRLIFTLVFGLCCSSSLFAQEPNIDSWKSNLLPPRNTLSIGQGIRMVDGRIQCISSEPADRKAQLGWIDHRLKKQPGNIQLWQEYLELLGPTY